MRTAGGDDSLLVDISDALSERDRVRFTVHTRTKLPQFSKNNMSVVRRHEEFLWLHDCLEEDDQYAGYIIPPAPPRPDFDASREKLQRLGDGEPNMTKEEFSKMKQELEAEYLAIFKKTVAMHEIFLQRLASHEKFRQDSNFKIFLEYENELAVRCKTTTEKLAGSIQNISRSISDLVLSVKQSGDDLEEIDEQYFERERLFLALYYNSIKEAANQADRVCQFQKCLADSYSNFGQNLVNLASVEGLKELLLKVSDYFEQARKLESRIASDEDLKITDTFLYYKRETAAAQNLLVRRLKYMSEYETAIKNTEKARQKGGTQMQYAEVIQKQAKENFVNISKLAKQELMDYKQRRVQAFKKAFSDLVELELKHLQNHSQLITDCINTCRGIETNSVQVETTSAKQVESPSVEISSEIDNNPVEDNENVASTSGVNLTKPE